MDLIEAAKAGITPTPALCEPFIVAYLEAQGLTSRANLVEAINSAWKENAGTPLPDGYSVHRVKKALSRLVDEGVVMSPIFSYYTLIGEDSESIATIPIDSPIDDDLADSLDEEIAEENAFELEVGDGSQTVYTFYLPTFRDAAEAQGKDRWPIKIGMTATGSVVWR